MKQSLIKKIKSKECIIDCHTHVGISFKKYISLAFPYCLNFESLVLRMKHIGVDYAIVFPMDSCYYIDKRYSKFPYEYENRMLLKEIYEIFPEYSKMAIPFLRFDPSCEIKKQVDLFRALNKDYPVFGLKTCTTYTQSFIKDLDTIGRSILDFAAKHNLPMIIHSSYAKEDLWAQIADILWIAEKYKSLKICMAHSARFVKRALEKTASFKNCYVDLSAFYIHCLLAQENHRAIPPENERFRADYSKPKSVFKKLVYEFGDTLIWGSDMPSNYFIQKYYGKNGELLDIHLKANFDSEIKLLNALPQKDRYRIAYHESVEKVEFSWLKS